MGAANSAIAADVSFLEKHKKWIVAFVLFGMYVSFGMSWMGVVPLRGELKDILQIDDTAGSRLVSIVSMAKSIVPILAGILAGRWGLTKTMRLSALLILSGLVIPFLPAYSAWVALKFLFGVGGAIWVTLMGAVTMQVFEARHRPLVNALNGVAITVGVVLALQITLPLTARFGWQMTLLSYSLISALFLVLLFLVGDLSFGNSPAASAGQGPSLKETLVAYLSTLKMPVTWLTSLAFAGPLALYLVLSYWLPVYYEDSLALEKVKTLQLMSWMNLGGILGSIATGLLLQRFGKTRPFIIIAAIVMPLSALGALYVTQLSLLPIILFVAGVGLFLSVSPIITLLQGQPGMTPALVGMILGTMFSITYILSYMAPEVVGMLYKSDKSLLQTILVVFSLTTVSPAIALLLKEKAE